MGALSGDSRLLLAEAGADTAQILDDIAMLDGADVPSPVGTGGVAAAQRPGSPSVFDGSCVAEIALFGIVAPNARLSPATKEGSATGIAADVFWTFCAMEAFLWTVVIVPARALSSTVGPTTVTGETIG
jgi:hypothetical protein